MAVVGRRLELQKILTKLTDRENKALIIQAGRGMGKTSVLQEVTNYSGDRDRQGNLLLVIYQDLRGIDNWDKVFTQAWQKVNESLHNLGKRYLQTTNDFGQVISFRRNILSLSQEGIYLCFCWDNVDNVESSIKITKLITSTQSTFVLSCCNIPSQFNSCDRIHLKVLTPLAVREMLEVLPDELMRDLAREWGGNLPYKLAWAIKSLQENEDITKAKAQFDSCLENFEKANQNNKILRFPVGGIRISNSNLLQFPSKI